MDQDGAYTNIDLMRMDITLEVGTDDDFEALKKGDKVEIVYSNGAIALTADFVVMSKLDASLVGDPIQISLMPDGEVELAAVEA